MSVIPPLELTPVEHPAHTFPVKGSISNPDGEACFTCAPPYQHSREWIPDPNGSKDRRLVLCFDGTGDSFDEDVSQFSSSAYSGSRLGLITCGICRIPMS